MKAGWEKVRIGEIASLVTKGTTPTSVGHEFREKGINFVKVESIDGNGGFIETKFAFIDDDCHEALKRSQLAEGDILFSIAGALGRTAIVSNAQLPANTNQALAIIRLTSPKEHLPEFVKLALSSGMLIEQIERQRGGVAQQNLSLAQVKSFQIPLPPLAEQKQIVSVLDRAFAGIERAAEAARKNRDNARELFETTLNATFTQKGEGWVETTLGDVCEFQGGSQPPKSVFSSEPSEGNIRLIQIRDYKSDKHIVYIPKEKARKTCTASDVMIGRYGPPLFQILRGIEGAYNVALMKAAPDEGRLSKDFLYFFLKNNTLLRYIIKSSSRAAGQIGLNKATLEPYPICFPSLAKQEEVVSSLTNLAKQTQRLEAIYQKKLDALDELKQSLLQKAFSGELTADFNADQLDVATSDKAEANLVS